ncbi:MAG: hypothetical protein DMF50_00580 [Acidobacteria bacterium]|nr:MAG: hypothetical protein DMF50_00580 [Acidobacteriota bacterium]
MRKMVRLVAVLMVVLALGVGSSMVMAAPIQGAQKAVAHSNNDGMLAHFMNILGAVWNGSIWGHCTGPVC